MQKHRNSNCCIFEGETGKFLAIKEGNCISYSKEPREELDEWKLPQYNYPGINKI